MGTGSVGNGYCVVVLTIGSIIVLPVSNSRRSNRSIFSIYLSIPCEATLICEYPIKTPIIPLIPISCWISLS